MPQFDEGHAIVEFDGARPLPAIAPELSTHAQVYRALVTGVRDYIGKNGFPGVLIGLSGGVDSALVLAVACDALGPERVRAVMMPSRFTADISTTDAAEMARRVGVRYDEIAIAPMFDAFRASLAEFAGRAEDATEENIQARIRGTLLMALSNKFGSIVLTTGNKSEIGGTPCRRYDGRGGFAVIRTSRRRSCTAAAIATKRLTTARRDPERSSRVRRRPSCARTRPTQPAVRRARRDRA